MSARAFAQPVLPVQATRVASGSDDAQTRPSDASAANVAGARSFGTPILYRGQLIGQIHLANRPTDYGEQDIELLEDICRFLAPVLQARLRHDEEQRRREIAESELKAANEELREKVEELERLTAALVDREERMVELKAKLAAHDEPS